VKGTVTVIVIGGDERRKRSEAAVSDGNQARLERHRYRAGMRRGSRSRRRRRLLIAVAVLIEPLAMKLRGYPLGGKLIVRCRRGHLFTTIWIPGASLKAIRLGWWRAQYCPVGRHWAIVVPVRESELTEDEKRLARDSHDVQPPRTCRRSAAQEEGRLR